MGEFNRSERHIEDNHLLPLNISDHTTVESHGSESHVYGAEVQAGSGKIAKIALKETRRPELAKETEISKSKAFYNFLKNHRSFGKFVLDTNMFIAKSSPAEDPKVYKVQKLLAGKRLDEMPDDQIYEDKELVNQLIEFIDAAKEVLVDLLAHPEFSKLDLYADKKNLKSFVFANFFQNPRYSSNILLLPKGQNESQRIFYVDAMPIRAPGQVLQYLDKKAQKITTKMQQKKLDEWKRKLLECV